MSIPLRTSHFKLCVVSLSDFTIRAFDNTTPKLPSQSYEQAFAYVAALTQSDPNTAIIDIRFIHDCRKDLPAIPRRGTLPQLWQELCAWNSHGYGIFININSMDGAGRYEIANVDAIRCQAIDLDTLSAEQNYQRAAAWNPQPSFAVQSSPGKFHVYWTTHYHRNRDGFTLLQRKLRSLFDGDKTIIDPSRVLRLPGTYHLKNPRQPHLITCWALAGYGKPLDPAFLEIALGNVNIVDGSGGRHELGDASLQAPSLDHAMRSLQLVDPNNLDRGEWISTTAAFKQAAWNYAPETQLFDIWSQWCARYATNDRSENIKNWNSVRNTQVGWPLLSRHPEMLFGDKREQRQLPSPILTGEILTPQEQREYFRDCILIENLGQIRTAKGRLMKSTEFNAAYGGKKFIIDGVGKITDEAWKAATRSTVGTIRKVDHIRFLPSKPHGEIITDALGRLGVNTYKPAIIHSEPGDVTPFLNHMALLFPNEADRKILFDYLAHCVKYPGFKIPWAPLIQSTEGAGKNAIKNVMRHAIGDNYTYEPKAKELAGNGSKFNGWIRERLFIMVDEIKTDERRDLLEALKPLISEHRIEVEKKGIDQVLDDNFANWMFFSNHKDAIPIDKNSRRYAVFFSALQTKEGMLRIGMDDQYFDRFYDGWLNVGGDRYVAHWLLNYPIERGAISMRAPITSSTNEALQESLSETEKIIAEMIENGNAGFRNGWISTAVVERDWPIRKSQPSSKTITKAFEKLEYHYVGRAQRAYFQDDRKRSVLWFKNDAGEGDVRNYAIDQGYGDH